MLVRSLRRVPKFLVYTFLESIHNEIALTCRWGSLDAANIDGGIVGRRRRQRFNDDPGKGARVASSDGCVFSPPFRLLS